MFHKSSLFFLEENSQKYKYHNKDRFSACSLFKKNGGFRHFSSCFFGFYRAFRMVNQPASFNASIVSPEAPHPIPRSHVPEDPHEREGGKL